MYIHADQGKLEPRALKGVFIGYPPGVKGYKVWLIEQKQCVISRNVQFQEQTMFKDIDKPVIQAVDQPVEQASTKVELVLDKGKGKLASDVAVKSDEVGSSTGGGAGGEKDKPEELGSDSETDEDEGTSVEEAGTDLVRYQLARDRKRRVIIPPSRYKNAPPPDHLTEDSEVAFALAVFEDIDVEEPKDYYEAIRSADKKQWKAVAVDEMNSLEKNETWDVVDRPKDRKVIGCRWIFKIKPGVPGGEPKRYKGRVVSKGYSQREGIDYQEVFSLVVRHIFIRIMLSLVVHEDLELEQMDVKTAFLHGSLEEEIFMEQPDGFEQGGEDKVCLLKKSLYGLKQSPRQWNKRFDKFMRDQEFTRSTQDQCVYIKEVAENRFVYLLLYVDDMLLAAKGMDEITKLKKLLSSEFDMKDLGSARRILGMDIFRNREAGTLQLSQSEYLQKVLKKFNMVDCKSSNTPVGAHFKLSAIEDASEMLNPEEIPYSSAVGSVMYAMVGSRPDLAYGVGLVSRYMSRPGELHWEAIKWLLRYIKGASKVCLTYTKGKEFAIEGFSDSDYAADLDRRRSISGYVFRVGGNTVSWRSCLQPIVALCTTEAEYIALTEAVKEGIWISGLLEELGYKQKKFSVWCDSQSAICLSKNKVYHERTKHFASKYHFIRDWVESGEVEVPKIPSSRNPADMLTKVIPVTKFNEALRLLNVIEA